ncbi:MAG: glycosyltransferase family 4 protein [Phycisphaeraceae bacterium]
MTASIPAAVAIVHYHLQSGGVSRVIAHAAAALHARGVKVAVIVGEAPPEASHLDAPVELAVLPDLGYDPPGQPRADGAGLADQLESVAKEMLGRAPDLFHVHNHSLGKNAALPGALRLLAERGHRLLLQPHDFAEDGRPDNYRHLLSGHAADALYPLAEQVHYALLTRRDRGLLAAAGIPAAQTHLLPNAVDLQAEPADEPPLSPSGKRLILYPTRAIRRKNVGEVLLWAAAADENDRFALTLAPTNPVHRPVYDRWKTVAAELALPVEFEVGSGGGADYIELLRSAHVLLTTSVAEGFGLTFLEPWLVGRALVGRDLPAVTEDFKVEHVDLSPLYEAVRVPVAWIGRETLQARLARLMTQAYQAYGQQCPADNIEAAMASLIDAADTVDFGRLDEPLQEKVIQQVANDADARAQLQPNALISPDADDPARVAANQRIVRDHFSLERYGERVLEVYASVLNSETGPVEALPADAMLRQWLSPERINLLRC